MSKEIKCHTWSHPDWDMKLTLRADGQDGNPEDHLPPESSADKLVLDKVEFLTQEQINDLPTFEG